MDMAYLQEWLFPQVITHRTTGKMDQHELGKIGTNYTGHLSSKNSELFKWERGFLCGHQADSESIRVWIVHSYVAVAGAKSLTSG